MPLAQATGNTRDNDYLQSCAYCNTHVGKNNLRVCGQCKFVRYCSRACQRAAWKTHKPRCQTGAEFRAALAEDDEAQAINDAFSAWLNCWRNTINTCTIRAFDLANSPSDKLATHFVFIKVEPRLGLSTVVQSFQMLSGKVMFRDDFIQVLRDRDCTQEQIDDWRNDDRGDHTVHIAIEFASFFRFLWFSLRDLSKWREMDKKTSADRAATWAPVLQACIETGLQYVSSSD
ncbi:hypothetical protein CERSUDRAFT_123486 [Gelatoporia subvermispora B]|uniref:MYND-type domain-containing protein n=1 Tax=Ceriporiopsis subvermispora (strain B) TaxID=914234 RepID=M2RFH9_CERS8|nr:hypothetical protein CERSUDRAFT_123486 [Gelatoporia subvermispora B]